MTTEYPVPDSLDMTWVVDVAQLPVSEAEPSLHIATIEAESKLPLQYRIASIDGFGNIQVNTFCPLFDCLLIVCSIALPLTGYYRAQHGRQSSHSITPAAAQPQYAPVSNFGKIVRF